MKNLNRLNAEKKLVLMMLTIMFIVVNVFLFYMAYARVKSNIEHASSKISSEINATIRENSSIATLLAATIHPYRKADVELSNSKINMIDVFTKTLSANESAITKSYYTDGKEMRSLSGKRIIANSSERSAQLSKVNNYIQETTRTLKNLHGFTAPNIFHSNIHNEINRHHSWFTIGVPVVITDYTSHATLIPGIIATDYTIDKIFTLFDNVFNRNGLDINRYNINIHSLGFSDTKMTISTSGFSLINFKIPDVNFVGDYHIATTTSLRSLFNSTPEIFINTNLLMTFISLLFLMLHNSSLKMLNRLVTDSLTQALSREGGRLVIEGLSARKGQVLVITDLNDFKIINDTYGHQTGDEALIAFSRYVMDSLQENDSMIRMGGDEFILLIGDASVRQVEDKMALLAEGLQSFHHEHDVIPLTFSYGVSEITRDFSDSYKRADERLYQMKKQLHTRKGS